MLAELIRRHAAESRAKTLSLVRSGGGRGLAATVRGVVAASVAAHAVDPELHRIFTVEGARLGIQTVDAAAPAGLAEELERWVASVHERRPNAELAVWIAWTAVHAVIHAAVVDRPEDATTETFIDEITRLVVRFLRA